MTCGHHFFTQFFVFFYQLVALFFQCRYSLKGNIVDLICHRSWSFCNGIDNCLDGGVGDSDWFGGVADCKGSWLRGSFNYTDSWLGCGVH